MVATMDFYDLSQRTRDDIDDSFLSSNARDMMDELRSTEGKPDNLETFANWLWRTWQEHERRAMENRGA